MAVGTLLELILDTSIQVFGCFYYWPLHSGGSSVFKLKRKEAVYV